MNKNINLLRVAVTSFSLLLSGCFPYSSETYYIRNMWLDSNKVYGLIENTEAIYFGSLYKDYGGMLSEEKKNTFIFKSPRDLFKPKTEIDLEDNDNYSSIIFEDKDFKVTRTVKSDVIEVGSKSTLIPMCTDSIWRKQTVIRFDNKLFYCGTIFDKTRKLLKEVPQSVVNEINGFQRDKQSENKYSGLHPPLYDFAIIDNKLLIASGYTSTSSVLKVAIWPLEKGGKLSWQNISIPTVPEGFSVANHYNVYAPSGFVLEPTKYQG